MIKRNRINGSYAAGNKPYAKAFMQLKEGLIKLGSRDLSRAKIMY